MRSVITQSAYIHMLKYRIMAIEKRHENYKITFHQISIKLVGPIREIISLCVSPSLTDVEILRMNTT